MSGKNWTKQKPNLINWVIDMEIITRKQAQEQGIVRFFTGKPCKYGHVSERKTINSRCLECHKVDMRKRYADPAAKKKIDKQNRKWVLENKHKVDEIKRRWEKLNPEKVKHGRQQYKKKNKEIIRLKRREYNSREETKVKNRSNTVARRAGLKRATPSWMPRSNLTEVYRKCAQMNKNSAQIYEVDHIVPLCNDIVCGLHVPWNLQIITRHQNRTKSNKLER